MSDLVAEAEMLREREFLKRELRGDVEGSLDERIARFLEVRHQGIVPNHHFAYASSECVNLYRDGYFLSAVMVSQAVTEGIWKFILERNQIPRSGDLPTVARELVSRGILSQACADAFVGIWNSFRNDVHHMNPPVANVPFRMVAKDNLLHLATVEREIFGVGFQDGKLVPKQAKYWDLRSDGTAAVFLRFPAVG